MLQFVLLDIRIKKLLHVYRVAVNIGLTCVAEVQQTISTGQNPSRESNISLAS